MFYKTCIKLLPRLQLFLFFALFLVYLHNNFNFSHLCYGDLNTGFLNGNITCQVVLIVLILHHILIFRTRVSQNQQTMCLQNN